MQLVRLLLLITLIVSVSCSINTTSHQLTDKEKAFRQFLKKFKVLSLPLTINTTGNFSPETFPEINANSTDTLFVNNPDTPNRCFGLLPDTTHYYGVVWLAPAEIYQVVLSTFTKSGEKIGERQLAVGQCGDDCGFSCSETLVIRPDYTIYATDSIARSTCNDDGNIMPGTTQTYVKMISGRVQATGKIDLSGVKTITHSRKKNEQIKRKI